ncbi:hypothetical protein AMATHDRAFT_86214, partial [Amanita thiersii Skay4041]
MVRVSANGSSDNKRESTNKRKSSASKAKKSLPATGVWPCKINGCNKEFAREADLKRHQRTTKLHSSPAFACPQCEATFTRPDALRRHQKSRHNGVIIEPKQLEKKETDDDDIQPATSTPTSRSGSATPSTKGKERVVEGGPMKYYRSHTATTTSYIPPRPPVMNPQYDQIALPTSATRLNNTPNWSYSHPWPEGTTHFPPIGYPHVPVYYTPSPHYRIDGPPPMLHPVSQMSGSSYVRSKPKSQEFDRSVSHQSSTSCTSSERTTTDQGDTSTASSPSNSSSVNVIDPCLENKEGNDPNKLTEEQVKAISLQITQAAMEAVLESAKQEVESRGSRTPGACETKDDYQDKVRTPMVATQLHAQAGAMPIKSNERRPGAQELTGAADSDILMNVKDPHAVQGYDSYSERSKSVDPSLENEPMLSPAEWLTQ